MDQDRRIRRDSWENSFPVAEVPVHGGTVIEKGDLIFLDKVNSLRARGTSVADFYAYPFSKISGSVLALESNKILAAVNFIGVAAHWSRSGVTENVPVFFGGLFKYPLKNSRSVKVSYYVTATGSGTTLHNQYVSISNSTSSAIGISGRKQEFASDVEMVLLNRTFGTAYWLL